MTLAYQFRPSFLFGLYFCLALFLLSPLDVFALPDVDYTRYCGTVVINTFGSNNCKTADGATEVPLETGATDCGGDPYDCCLTSLTALTPGQSCPIVALPAPDPTVPAPTCGELNYGYCHIGTTSQIPGTFVTCPEAGEKCCYTQPQCETGDTPKSCGIVDGYLCKTANGTTLGLTSSFASCSNNPEICCRESSSCPASGSTCGISTGNACLIDNKYYRHSTGCGSSSSTCCLDEQFCANQATCAQEYNPAVGICRCTGSPLNSAGSSGNACCGWVYNSTCNAARPTGCSSIEGCGFCSNPTDYCSVRGGLSTCIQVPGLCGTSPPPPDTGSGGSGGVPADPPTGGGSGGGTTEEDPAITPTLDIFAGPSSADFKMLNPFEMYNSPYKNQFNSPAGIINRALLFAFPLAGLLLFVMIVWGGFEMVSGATNTKSLQAGRQRITAALMGFGLLFISYWIIQIVEYIFNLAIL